MQLIGDPAGSPIARRMQHALPQQH
jgi:hypothetical protein